MGRLKTIALITAACCASAMMPLAAQAKAMKFTSGLIAADGSITNGSGFLALRNGAGDYTIVFGKGAFKKAPIFTCTASGITSLLPICDVWSDQYFADGSASVEFRLYARSSGAIEDNAFSFIEVTSN